MTAVEYAIKRLDAATMSYQGRISEGSFQNLLPHLNAEINTLRIRSEGGDAEEASLIGADIFGRKFNIIIDRYCLSARANYVFLAAHKNT